MSADHPQLAETPRRARRLLIVDDHAGFRHCARALLEDEGFEVVGEAADGAAALAAVARLDPEVVLLDVQLPDADGFEITRRLVMDDPGLPVVLVSSRDRSQYGRLIETSGARGFVAKTELSGAALAGLLA